MRLVIITRNSYFSIWLRYLGAKLSVMCKLHTDIKSITARPIKVQKQLNIFFTRIIPESVDAIYELGHVFSVINIRCLRVENLIQWKRKSRSKKTFNKLVEIVYRSTLWSSCSLPLVIYMDSIVDVKYYRLWAIFCTALQYKPHPRFKQRQENEISLPSKLYR